MSEQPVMFTQSAIALAWLPVTVLTAAVDGYYQAFFAVLDGTAL